MQGRSLPRLLTPLDALLILTILLGALAWTWHAWAGGGPPTVAVVLHRGREVARLPLSRDASVSVEGDLGPLTFEIADGRVRCVESPCPHRICIAMGWRGRAGETIACVPSRVSVWVRGEGAEAPDAVTR